MYLSKFTSVFLILTCAFFSMGQDLNADFKAIVNTMEKSNSVAIEVDVLVYGQKGGSLIYKSEASLLKMDKSVRNVLAEIEIFRTPDFDLNIDHEERAIMIVKKDSVKEMGKNVELSEFDVKKLQKFFEEHQTKSNAEVKMNSNTNGIKKYTITGTNGIKELNLVLNMNSFKIVKITYEYGTSSQKGQYVVLDYSKFSYNEDLSSKFDLTNYFKVVDSSYVLVNKLKGYKIYNER